VGFNPSTQRHYLRLIYYLYIHTYLYIHVSVVRPSSIWKIYYYLRTTQLTTEPYSPANAVAQNELFFPSFLLKLLLSKIFRWCILIVCSFCIKCL
jgi:hypothetical protein